MECAALGVSEAMIAQPQGCEACNHTGYKGRIGIYELVEVDDKVREMIHAEVAEQEIKAYVHSQHPAIQDSARNLVISQQTTLEEVLRVTQA